MATVLNDEGTALRSGPREFTTSYCGGIRNYDSIFFFQFCQVQQNIEKINNGSFLNVLD